MNILQQTIKDNLLTYRGTSAVEKLKANKLKQPTLAKNTYSDINRSNKKKINSARIDVGNSSKNQSQPHAY
jgi:hypothetical protein